MRRSLEFALRLLDGAYPAHAAWEDFAGPHGDVLRVFQGLGFLDAEPGMNPIPSCPACAAGVPYRLDGRYLCPRCRSEVDGRSLQLWRFDLEALLEWFASQQSLRGGVERVDDGLWRLGTLDHRPLLSECFYLRGEGCSTLARHRLAAFREVLLLHGRREPPRVEGGEVPALSLAEVLSCDGSALAARPLPSLLRKGGDVRFDPRTGAIRIGDAMLGHIPAGTRELAFVARLAASIGEVVPYADLKHHVCAETGSRDEADEATFCQKLKSRIKNEHGIARIDRLIRADRKGGGYLLLPEAEPDGA